METIESDEQNLLTTCAGSADPTQWVDITGSTPLKLTGNCVSFTTNVSARFEIERLFTVATIYSHERYRCLIFFLLMLRLLD
jgi:hypothetical protein